MLPETFVQRLTSRRSSDGVEMKIAGSRNNDSGRRRRQMFVFASVLVDVKTTSEFGAGFGEYPIGQITAMKMA